MQFCLRFAFGTNEYFSIIQTRLKTAVGGDEILQKYFDYPGVCSPKKYIVVHMEGIIVVEHEVIQVDGQEYKEKKLISVACNMLLNVAVHKSDSSCMVVDKARSHIELIVLNILKNSFENVHASWSSEFRVGLLSGPTRALSKFSNFMVL